jgi:hypothetical protein
VNASIFAFWGTMVFGGRITLGRTLIGRSSRSHPPPTEVSASLNPITKVRPRLLRAGQLFEGKSDIRQRFSLDLRAPSPCNRAVSKTIRRLLGRAETSANVSLSILRNAPFASWELIPCSKRRYGSRLAGGGAIANPCSPSPLRYSFRRWSWRSLSACVLLFIRLQPGRGGRERLSRPARLRLFEEFIREYVDGNPNWIDHPRRDVHGLAGG